MRDNIAELSQQDEDNSSPLDFFMWTDEELAKLPFLELLVLAFDGEASLHPGGVFSTERLFQKLTLGPNDYVLEIGCGSAKDLCRLVEKYNCRAIGVDSSDLILKSAKDRVRKTGLSSKITIIKGDVANMNFFLDGQFDIVIAQSVLATIPDKDKVATEVSRVLKSGGQFGDIELIWIDEPDDELVYNVEKRIGSFDRPLKLSEWIGLFKKAGLKETNIFTSNDFGFPTDIFDVIKHNGGLVESMKLLMFMMSRGNRINLTKRTEHVRWMRDSGKIGYGIYV
ncbi:MAG TPA: class I SAM-dependent methyltransferase, partial [Nitrososphaeraceae archaeon]|nr:class I SAM-dependent methyltransferase [Nitrososphaeraceae archaeon]